MWHLKKIRCRWGVGKEFMKKIDGEKSRKSGGGGISVKLQRYWFFWGGIPKMLPMFISDVWNLYIQHMVWIGKFLCWTCWFTSDKTNFPKKFRFLICLDSASPTQFSGLWSADKYTFWNKGELSSSLQPLGVPHRGQQPLGWCLQLSSGELLGETVSKVVQKKLVGGYLVSTHLYSSIWIISPSMGWKLNMFETTTQKIMQQNIHPKDPWDERYTIFTYVT